MKKPSQLAILLFLIICLAGLRSCTPGSSSESKDARYENLNLVFEQTFQTAVKGDIADFSLSAHVKPLYLQFFPADRGYSVIYYNPSAHSVVKKSIITSDEELEIEISLRRDFPVSAYGKVIEFSALTPDTAVIATDSVYALFAGEEIVKIKKHRDVFGEELTPFPSDKVRNTKPYYRDGKTLIGVSGRSRRLDKEHENDFEPFALLDVKELEAELLPFNFPEINLAYASFFAPPLFSFSDVKGKPYIRIGYDSVMYDLSSSDFKTIPVKSYTRGEKRFADSLLLNHRTARLFRSKVLSNSSNLFYFEEKGIYVSAGFIPVTIGSDREKDDYNPRYRVYVDFYDQNLNFIERINLDEKGLMPPVYADDSGLIFSVYEPGDKENDTSYHRYKVFRIRT